MQEKRDSIYGLIASLSSSEKRALRLFVRKYNKEKSSNTDRLLEAYLAKIASSGARSLKQLLKKEPQILNNLSYEKTRLRKAILRCLSDLNYRKDPFYKVLDSVKESRILFDKKQYLQSAKLARKAREMADRQSFFSFSILLNKVESKTLGFIFGKQCAVEKRIALLENSIESAEGFLRVERMRIVAEKVFLLEGSNLTGSERRKKVEEILSQYALPRVEELDTIFDQFLLCQLYYVLQNVGVVDREYGLKIMSGLLARMKGKEARTELESRPAMIYFLRGFYFQSLLNSPKKLKEAKKILSEFDSRPFSSSAFEKENIRNYITEKKKVLAISWALHQKDFRLLKKICESEDIQSIEKIKLQSATLQNLIYFLVVSYCLLERWQEALELAETFLAQMKDSHLKNSPWDLLSFLVLLCHSKIGNRRGIAALQKRASRAESKRERVDKERGRKVRDFVNAFASAEKLETYCNKNREFWLAKKLEGSLPKRIELLLIQRFLSPSGNF